MIERVANARVAVIEIASRLGRHRSTIDRELARNRFTDEENPYLDGYYSSVAHEIAADQRARHRKLAQLPMRLLAVVDRLRAGWSPERIAGRLKRKGGTVRVSHEAIYA